jgi:hypothetical protein
MKKTLLFYAVCLLVSVAANAQVTGTTSASTTSNSNSYTAQLGAWWVGKPVDTYANKPATVCIWNNMGLATIYDADQNSRWNGVGAFVTTSRNVELNSWSYYSGGRWGYYTGTGANRRWVNVTPFSGPWNWTGDPRVRIIYNGNGNYLEFSGKDSLSRPPQNAIPSGGAYGNTADSWANEMDVLIKITYQGSSGPHAEIYRWASYHVAYSGNSNESSGDATIPGGVSGPTTTESHPQPYGSNVSFGVGQNGSNIPNSEATQMGTYTDNINNMSGGRAGRARGYPVTHVDMDGNYTALRANTNISKMWGFLRVNQSYAGSSQPNYPIGTLKANRAVQRNGLQIALAATGIVKEYPQGGQSHTALRITRMDTAPSNRNVQDVVSAPTGETVAQVSGNEISSITATSTPYMESERAAKTTYYVLWAQLGSSHSTLGNQGKWSQLSWLAVDRYGTTVNLAANVNDKLPYVTNRYRTRQDLPWTVNLDFQQAFLDPSDSRAEGGDYALDMKTATTGLATALPASVGGLYLSASGPTVPLSSGSSYGTTSYFRRTTASMSEIRPLQIGSAFQSTTGGGLALYQPFTQATRSTDWTAGNLDSATSGTALFAPMGVDVFPLANYSTSVFGTGLFSPAFGQTVDYRGLFELDDSANGVGVATNVYPNSLLVGLLKRPDGTWVKLWESSDTTGRVVASPGPGIGNVNIGDQINQNGNYEYHVIEYSPVDTDTLANIGVDGAGATMAASSATAHVAAVSTALGQAASASNFGWARVARYLFAGTNEVRLNASLVTAQ